MNTTVLDIIKTNEQSQYIYQLKPKVRVKTIYPRSQVLWTALINNPFKYLHLSTSKLGEKFDLCKIQAWKVKATAINYSKAEVPPPPLWKRVNPRFKPSPNTSHYKGND